MSVSRKSTTTLAHLFLRLPDDTQRNPRTEIPDTSQAWIHESSGTFLGIQGRGEGDGCSFDHAVRDLARSGEDRAEADAGEDVHIIALAGFVSHLIVRHGLVRTTGCIDDLAVCPGRELRLNEMPKWAKRDCLPRDGILIVEFAEINRVGEGEYDGPRV